MKAFLDLEQIKSTMSCQISALENFLKTVVSEAKDVVWDIQNTLNEQKQILAFSAQHQEKVSEASRNIEDSITQGNKRLLEEIFSMQQVSSDAKEEVNVYLEKVKRHFLEDIFTSAKTKATMESCLQKCTNMVNYSRQ
ncbi:Kinesin-like protein KIN-5B [Camellia lanceoleosa]|uniref:Kinesin-like protein KIN-5B n=1 Tax=Camellia lanceoleosa TaxID=1840588 RepID=A0ACC0GW00_9ERIC|nr:Kinesin-like protein KIN-5B [Camellia lanceoleosa]